MSDDQTTEDVRTAHALVRRINPLLCGKDGGVIGAALAEIFALWLASYQGEKREEVMAHWLEVTREIVKVNDLKARFGLREQ